MNCFKHHDRVALGICKSCGKGVCSECAVSRKNGLACRDECEERVDLLNKMVDNNVKTLAVAGYQTKSNGVLTIIVGVVLLFFGVVWLFKDGWGPTAAFTAALGVVIVAMGIIRLNKKSTYPDPEK